MPLTGDAKKAYQRDYMRQRRAKAAGKPVDPPPVRPQVRPAPEDGAKDREIASLKARIAELEAAARRSDAIPPFRSFDPLRTPTTGDTRLMKLIRRLDAPENEHEAAGAARMLANELQARGRSFQGLANLTAQWDREDAATRKPKPRPVDWPEVERAIEACVDGKTKVSMNAVFKAIGARVPAFGEYREAGFGRTKHSFVDRCLQRLGFIASRSRLTYERSAPAD
jgi:hypothetical protein